MNHSLEDAVATHYGRSDLYEAILAGLDATGRGRDDLTPEDLASVDEFHTAGRGATLRALSELSLAPNIRVLDAGCGIGGTARHIAHVYGCAVDGVDLTPEYVDVANRLSALLGLSERCQFRRASVLALPFGDSFFDAAVSLHVAMNVKDRPGFYREIFRVLRPGAQALWYDVMLGAAGDVRFPVPWAASKSTSFLFDADATETLLADAGFDIDRRISLRDLAIDYFRDGAVRASAGPPPLGLHLLTGADSKSKFANYLESLEAGLLEPMIVVARRRASV